MLLAITVMLAATVSMFAFDLAETTNQGAGPTIVDGENLVQNPAFESGDDHWDLQWGGMVVADAGYDGSNGLRAADYDWVPQDVTSTIHTDRTYRFCAWSRLTDDAPGDEAWVGVQFYDESNSITEKHTWRVTWTEYRNECREFLAPDTFDSVDVWVYTETGAIYVDEISLVPIRTLGD